MPLTSQPPPCQFKGTVIRTMPCEEIEHSSVFDHQSLLVHSREKEADSIVWKSAVHSRSETTLYKPMSSSEEAVDPWADERRELWR